MSDFSEDVYESVVNALVKGIKSWAPDLEGDASLNETACYLDGVEVGVRMTLAYLNDEEIDE